MARVVVYIDNNTQEKESIESAIKRFKKVAFKDEIVLECKKRQYFMSKREKRKFKHDMAIRRAKNKKYR